MDRRAKLSALRAKVNDSYNASVTTAGKFRELRRAPTGIVSLDYALGSSLDGIGGIPIGHITGLVGWQSHGKTTIALKAVAGLQRLCANCSRPAANVHAVPVLGEDGTPLLDEDGDPVYELAGKCKCYADGEWAPQPPLFKGKASERKAQKEAWAEYLAEVEKNSFEGMVVVYADQENTLDVEWAKKQGVFTECIEHFIPGFAEQCIDVVDEYIKSGAVDVIVVDSIAAMVPSKEIEDTSENWQQGLQARLINKAVRKWVGSASSVSTENGGHPVTQIWVQQWRQKIGPFGGKVMPGGNGQLFAYSVLMEVIKTDVETIDEAVFVAAVSKDDVVKVDRTARFRVKPSKKNKTAPQRQASFRMALIDDEDMKAGDVLQLDYVFKLAMQLGIVDRDGSKYMFRGKKFTSQSGVMALMATNETVFDWTKREVMKALMLASKS